MAGSGRASVTRVAQAGLPALRLETAGGASALVALHGAQVLSWRPAGGGERLFLSERAEYAAGRAIRGGVPICFPQFAALGSLPKHGLVRTREWRQAGEAGDGGESVARLIFEPDAESLARWPHPARVEYAVRLDETRLSLELSVDNTGERPLSFTAALHGYLAVEEVESAAIEGLAGIEYRDAAGGDRIRVEVEPIVRIRGEVDRVYHSVLGEVTLREAGRSLALRAEGFPDVVVWNPGAVKCASLPDMPPDGWRRMLCIEAGAIRTPVVVPAGASWRGRQILTAR